MWYPTAIPQWSSWGLITLSHLGNCWCYSKRDKTKQRIRCLCNCLIDQNFPAQTLGSLLRLALGSSKMGSRFSWRLKVFDVKMRGLGEGKALGLLGGHTCLLNPPRSHIWRFLLVVQSGGACRAPSRMASQASGQRYPEYISTYLSPQRIVLRTPLCPVFSPAPGLACCPSWQLWGAGQKGGHCAMHGPSLCRPPELFLVSCPVGVGGGGKQ